MIDIAQESYLQGYHDGKYDTYDAAYTTGYNNGYITGTSYAPEHASLTHLYTDGYDISFDGEIHHYDIHNNEQILVDIPGYELTAYCACLDCCGKTDGITSTGTHATANHTIAVDKNQIPYGSKVLWNGITYTAEDCGGDIKQKRIDVYFDTHIEALKFGRVKNQTITLILENK